MIVISAEKDREREPEIWLQLLSAGLQSLHIRKYHWSEYEILSAIEEIPSDMRSALVLHSHQHLANELGIDRLHFREEQHLQIQAHEVRNKRISCSVHSIQAFNKLGPIWEYAFLSPVFPSISKSGYEASDDLLQSIRQRENEQVKLVALGGLNAGNLSEALAVGFDDIALLGAIWQSDSPIDEYLNIQQTLSEHLKNKA